MDSREDALEGLSDVIDLRPDNHFLQASGHPLTDVEHMKGEILEYSCKEKFDFIGSWKRAMEGGETARDVQAKIYRDNLNVVERYREDLAWTVHRPADLNIFGTFAFSAETWTVL